MILGFFFGEVHVYEGEDLKGTLEGAIAGDEIIVHEGTYPTGSKWTLNFQGTELEPIIVRPADGEAVIIQGIPSQNIIDIGGTYYTWRGFEMIGGSHGIRVETSAHALFEDLHLHAVGDVGISCNRTGMTYEDVTIRGLHIHDTGVDGGPGECMYLGCNDDACQMWDSLIEYNWCHDTSGSQGDGIELKTGSYNTVVRHNVIHDVNYPGITMYGTVDGKAANLVEGNVVWNVVDNGIQTVGDVIVRNNIVMNVGANGIHAKPSQGEEVLALSVVNNTVYNPGGTCLRGNDFLATNGNLIANNAFLCAGGTAMNLPSGSGDATVAGNAVDGGVQGAGSGTFTVTTGSAVLDAAGMDLYPIAGGPLVDAGEASFAPSDDYNAIPRDATPDVGAYEWTQAENPCPIVSGFKDCDLGGDGDGDSGDGDGDGDSGDGDGDSGDGDGDGDGSSGEDDAGLDTGEVSESDATGPEESADSGENEDGEPSGCACSSRHGSTPWSLLLFGPLVFARRRRPPRSH
jgi:hypothetical protein